MNFAAIPRSRHLSERFRIRMATGIVLSLLIHGFILSMQLGLPGLGLPGLELPWNQRRVQAQSLSIQLANVVPPPAHESEAAQVVREPITFPPLPAPPVIDATAPSASNSATFKLVPQQHPTPPPELMVAPPEVPIRREPARPKFHPRIITRKSPTQDSVAVPPPNLDEPEQETPPLADTQKPAEVVAEPPVVDVPPVAPAIDARNEAQRFAAENQAHNQEHKEQELAATKQEEQNAKRRAAEAEAEQKQADDAARQQAAALAQQALAKQKTVEAEAARQMNEAEAKKQEDSAKMQLAMELKAQKQKEEVARQAAALALQKQTAQKLEEQEIARRAEALELKKQEEAKAQRRAIELQAQKQADEIARQKATIEQKIAAELAALEKAQGIARKEADAAKAQEEANKNKQPANTHGTDVSNRETGTAGNAPISLGHPLASQLIEQARKSDLFRNELPLAKPSTGAAENPGRRSIFGSLAADISVTMYVESWRMKIERNGNFNYSQSSKDRARGDPVVTVIIRSDGSVEDVIIHHTSGRPEIDEAVRRIVRLNSRYAAFPSDLARKYDVIEIRRIWSFDDRLRILEEVH